MGCATDIITTAKRLRDFADVVHCALPWCGSLRQALAWYRAQPLPSFDGQTAQDLFKRGRAMDVKNYLSRISIGGFA